MTKEKLEYLNDLVTSQELIRRLIDIILLPYPNIEFQDNDKTNSVNLIKLDDRTRKELKDKMYDL